MAALAWSLAACGGGRQPSVAPGGAPVDGTGSGRAAAVDVPACDDAQRSYEPPPEEQPPADPAITTARVAPDLAVTTGAPATDVPIGDSDGGESAIAAARSWAQREAPDAFAGLWFDRDHGAMVMAFTGDVDRYATQIRDRFGAGWWIVEGDHSLAELERLQRDVIADQRVDAQGDATRPGSIVSSALDEARQRVGVTVAGGDDAAIAVVAERLDHPAICFHVLPPPPTYDPDGPVRTLAIAARWRDGLQPGYSLLEIAYDREEGERAFAENVRDGMGEAEGAPPVDGLHADLGTVDWDREVIAVWSAGRGSNCPVWVDDIRVEDGAIRVDEATTTRGGCAEDFNAFRTVLAIDRDRVPAPDQLPLPVNGGGDSQAVRYPAG